MNNGHSLPNDHEADSCQHCHYYHEHSAGSGDCHRFPPSFAGEATPNEKHRWKHPLVPHSNWCGEFRERIPLGRRPEST